MDKESHISIFVKKMRVNLRLGLYEYEREKPQPVDVSVELYADVSYLEGADAESIIDYARIYEAVKSWEERDHVELIETYLRALLDLAFGFKRVSAVRASISKPTIFEEAEQAGVEVFMCRTDY